MGKAHKESDELLHPEPYNKRKKNNTMSNQENTECMEGSHRMVKMMPPTAMPRLPGCTLRSLNKHFAGWEEKAVPQEATQYKHTVISQTSVEPLLF